MTEESKVRVDRLFQEAKAILLKIADESGMGSATLLVHVNTHRKDIRIRRLLEIKVEDEERT